MAKIRTAVWSLLQLLTGSMGAGAARMVQPGTDRDIAEVLPVDIDLVVLPVQVDAVSDGWQREWHHALEQALDRSVRRVEVRALEAARSTANAAWTTVFDIDETHKYATWADFRHPGTPSRDFDD